MTDPGRGGSVDDAYQVLCVDRDRTRGENHDHVASIQTRDPDGGETRWKAVDVIAAIRDGATFVVMRDGEDGMSLLQPAICPSCPVATLRTEPGATAPAACDDDAS